MGGEIIDQPNGYGPVNVRTLDKSLALKNADSYAYFASVSGRCNSLYVLVSYMITGSLVVCNLFKELC